MKTQAGVLDRVEQSFELMKDHFIPLVSPLVIFYVGAYYVLYFLVFFFSKNYAFDPGNLASIFTTGNFIVFLLSFAAIVAYLILAVAVTIGLIRSIADAYQGRPVDARTNYRYGWYHIMNSFQTYYCIFLYVYAIPALIVIAWGLWMLSDLSAGGFPVMPETNSIILMVLLILGLLFFMAYRWLRTTFSLMVSVDRDEYSKNIFDSSLSLTDGQWWRICGNMLFLGLLVSIASGIVTSFIPADSFFTTVSSWTDLTSAQVLSSIKQMTSFHVLDIVHKLIGVVGILFSAVFSYVFFKRLEEEKSSVE